jgi:hypothetical protein
MSEEVLYECEVPKDQRGMLDDTPNVYRVATNPSCVCIIYGKYRERWEANVSARWLVRHLLDRLATEKKRWAKLQGLIDKIVISDGTDAGVILLSDASPTRYDETLKCHVYKHENFSELGDALVAIANEIKAAIAAAEEEVK